MSEQISLMKKTDYLVGIHGAGLTLGIFLPLSSIYHEILHKESWKVVLFLSMMSGHKCYFDLVNSTDNTTNDFEYISFDENDFVEKVKNHMKENNLF